MNSIISQWKADLLRTVRDRRFLLISLIMPVTFYLIFIHDGKAAIAGTDWGAYFMVSMASFGVVGAAVNTLGVRLSAERQGGWVRWLRTTPLSAVGYALVKVATQLLISLIIVLVVFLAAHVDQAVTLSTGRWAVLLAWLWIGSVPFAALGVLIGLAKTSAQVLGTLAFVGLSLLGGLLTPVQSLSPTMRTLAYWMPTYRYADPAWNLLAGRSLGLSNMAYLVGYTVIFLAAAAFVQQHLDSHPNAN
ncbi:MAG: ABC transporter [Sulfobacillus acidophilus]|uniref:ABC transporter n=1 Tax=Sulfobacillus acidophilus TaxID=53633 RepID=A0A2T2WF64_9FIRM|nr:MAG: ABC transporter [Sulfobacillus acidophilus]